MHLRHVFVRGIRADTELQYPVRKKGGVSFQSWPLHQSALDSACGLHSVLQIAMVLLGIPRRRIENLSREKHGALSKLWQVSTATYFKGAHPEDIKTLIAAFKPNLSCRVIYGSRPAFLGETAVKAIDAGNVAILGFNTRSYSHWTTISGYEMDEERRKPRALLCLDPLSEAPWCSFYNYRAELQGRFISKRFRHPYHVPYRGVDGSLQAVELDTIIVVRRSDRKT